jgi:DNA-binding CsgD family transcriptional regulator
MQASIQTDPGKVPWEAIYEFVLTCGNFHSLKSFSQAVIDSVGQLVPYDQGRIYYFNGNGKISDQYLVNVDSKWANAYHEYYSKIEDGRYSFPVRQENAPIYRDSLVHGRVWVDAPRDEFTSDYIAPLGLKYSIAFTMFDPNGFPRTYFMLDRTGTMPFSDQEVNTLNLAVAQLNNLHKNFFSEVSGVKRLRDISWETSGLTSREIEVANLLCHGVKPANIGNKLNITISTTYKHIAHIYEKMHVSSRQELMTKVLNN